MRSKTIIIAEAGVNHNGDLETAKKLIRVAAEAGVDYVKFQTFKADKLVSKDARKADYQQRNIADGDSSQYTMLKKLELSEEDHFVLYKYAAENNVKFLSTGFDLESLDFLSDLGIDVFKIPSGEITNYPYLVRIAEKKLPIILSTGMSDEQEIVDALEVLIAHGAAREQITVLHCNTEYPTPMQDVNLKAMLTIAEDLKVRYGYSDHTLGVEVPIAAVALGATIIEKHFTLDRTLPGPDHKASLEPGELKYMVQCIRNLELAMQGDGVKKPSASELKNKVIGRKSIFYGKNLSAGHVIGPDDLIMKRPGDGISPMKYPDVVGKRLRTDVLEGTKITWENLE